MAIEIVSSESMGVRGLCCYVTIPGRRILIDPGIALGYMRHQLLPHPFQVAVDERKPAGGFYAALILCGGRGCFWRHAGSGFMRICRFLKAGMSSTERPLPAGMFTGSRRESSTRHISWRNSTDKNFQKASR